VKEQDYKTTARSRLTDRHRSDETFLAILDTLVEIKSQRQQQYLDIADTFLDIDKSEGKNLDLIGKLIGEERTLVNFIDRSYFGFLGARLSESYDIGYWYSLYKNKYGTLRTLTDQEYRRVLKARVVKNSSDNNRNSFIEVLNILSGNKNSSITESYNNTAITVNIEDIDGLVSYYLSKYKSDKNLIPVPLGRRLNINHVTSSDGGGETPTISCVDSPDNVSFYVTRTGQGGNTTFYLEYKTPNGVVMTNADLESIGVTVEDVYGDGFYVRLTNASTQPIQLIVTLVQIGVEEFVLSHDYSGVVTVLEEGVSYGICLSPPAPAFGDWVLNQEFTVVGDDIRYTGYKTNGIDTYDSFASSSLQDALVKSFLDPDLQQYAAFTTAVEQLLGAVDWILDPTNNQIKYEVPPSDPNSPQNQFYWVSVYNLTRSSTYTEAANKMVAETCRLNNYHSCSIPYDFTVISSDSSGPSAYSFKYDTYTSSGTKTVRNSNTTRVVNPDYDPNATPEENYLPLDVVAQKVISNAESSTDEALKMLSEDFIDLVVNSVFDNNPSKQFVKLEDLIPQLEANKVLR